MHYSRGLISSQPGRLESLRAKHEALKERIHEELKHPATGGDILKRLKLEKLRVKEEIEEIRRA